MVAHLALAQMVNWMTGNVGTGSCCADGSIREDDDVDACASLWLVEIDCAADSKLFNRVIGWRVIPH